MKKLVNTNGVAIILVLSSLLLLTTLVSQLLNRTMTAHELALNYQKRVQSYYLAQSGLNLSKMLLYYNKKVEDLLQKRNLTYADLGVDALYKQVPIDSTALRLLLAMSGGGEEAVAPEEEVAKEPVAEEGESEGESQEDQTQQALGMFEKDKIEEFLDFEGDFFAEISEEETKYSLNAITKLSATTTTTGDQGESGYDLQKRILLSILSESGFKKYFENQDRDAEQLVHALADFADSNTSINEFGGIERGYEGSLYDEPDFHVKSAPYLTLSEMRLVAGMNDELYAVLEPYVTVYNNNETINVCMGSQELFEALIVHFSQYSKCTAPLDPEKDAEQITKIREEAYAKCPNASDVTAVVNEALGISSTTTTNESASTTTTTNTATTPSTSNTTATDCVLKFSDLISTSNTIFRVKGSGEVDGVVTTIETVINTSAAKPSSWAVLYYQVD